MVELQRSREALHMEATHDSLTGLANRRLFYDRLQQAIRLAIATAARWASCMSIWTASRKSTISTATMWATPC